MDRLFNAKRKKLREPPQQATSPGELTDVTAGSSSARSEREVYSKGRVRVHQGLEDRMSEDIDISPPTSRTWTSSHAIGGIEHGSNPTTGSASDFRGEDADPAGVPKAKRAHGDTMLEGDLTDVARGAMERFGPLKVVLETIPAIYANHKGTTTIGSEIEHLLSRVVVLEARFDSRPDDVTDQRRRDELIRKFGRIEGQLKALTDKSELRAEEISGLLEDLRETIFDYQLVRQQEIHERQCKAIDPSEVAVLNNFRGAQGAEYRHGNRKGCLKGTREDVLGEIGLWASDFGRSPIYWLNGLAGTGKSTIAQTIAERIFSDGQLGASFFCSRDFEDRSNLQLIFPTLAVQLARNYPEFRSRFVPLVQSDPGIARESLYNQLDKLIMRPLEKSTISTMIVIDALDECRDEDDESASLILSVLGRLVSKSSSVKFFVTGRPEPRIREGFRLPLLAKATDVFVLHGVESGRVRSDIRLFFRHSFSELKGCQPGLDNWPTEEQLDLLCKRAAGLFVYATATVRFINQRNHSPKKQLDRLLQSPESSAFEGKTKFKASTTLDSLYMSILQGAFGDDDPEDDSRVRSVLGAVVFATNPLSPSTISTLLGLEAEDTLPLLSSMHSLLTLQEDIHHPVRPFHKSFPDFLVNPSRCSNPRFRVCPLDQHAELLLGCLELMNRTLEHNICKLPNGVANSEVDDLMDRVERHIDRALQYACRSWHKHLVKTSPTHTTSIMPILERFLEGKFLFWLEVLSVLGAARGAVGALDVTAKWLDSASPTLDLVNDYFRFVITFFEVINASAPHIYHSAVILSPQKSIVRKLYNRYAYPFVKVARGLPESWEPIAATTYRDDLIEATAWSPCNGFIAVSWFKSGMVEILDAVTLEQLNTLESPPSHDLLYQRLSFSADGRFLTRFNSRELFSWDLQTGGPLGAVPSKSHGMEPLGQCFSSSYSADGKTAAVAYMDPSTTTSSTIVTYDLLSRTRISSYRVWEGRMVAPIWTHDECLRFATVKPGSISIWEVAFTLINAPAEVTSLPAPETITDAIDYLFLPTKSRLAFSLKKSISVWDASRSRVLLDYTRESEFAEMSFSSDGRFFACATIAGEIHVWKNTLDSYLPWQDFTFASTRLIPHLSPNGDSLIGIDTSTIHLWSTKDSVTRPSGGPTQVIHRTNFALGFSPDRKSAAVARSGENKVTLFDLESGDSWFTIDAGMKVFCLGMSGGAVVVVGDGKIVTWSLPARDRALDTGENIDDSIRSTPFDHSGQYQASLERPETYISLSSNLNYMAIVKDDRKISFLDVYDVHTGKRLTGVSTIWVSGLWFARGRQEVWCTHLRIPQDGWEIVQDSESGLAQLVPLKSTASPSGGTPWQSSRGYKVTRDGWVLNSTQERILWLPHRWRSGEKQRIWNEQFLGLLHRGLSEVVILKFP